MTSSAQRFMRSYPTGPIAQALKLACKSTLDILGAGCAGRRSGQHHDIETGVWVDALADALARFVNALAANALTANALTAKVAKMFTSKPLYKISLHRRGDVLFCNREPQPVSR